MIAVWLNRFWYRRSWLSFLLWPVSGLFICIVYLRRWAYKLNLLTVKRYPLPIIVVGNITVGGCGKTPLVIHLVNYLQQHGYRPAIVSRGYGGQTQQQVVGVNQHHSAEQVGDEAVLMQRHCAVPLFIHHQRTKAVEYLLQHSDCNVVVCDDGLQHYALARDIEIAVIDGERRFGNGLCLPVGPLREPQRRLREVDFMVTNGTAQTGEYAMQLTPGFLVNIIQQDIKKPSDDFKQQQIHAVAGIGHPQRFFKTLRDLGLQFSEHVFADHHQFVADDFNTMSTGIIIMTEKDAVKCQTLADERFWFLPVVAVIDEAFDQQLLQTLTNIS